MESYIEITWFTSFLILMNACTLAFYLINQPCFFRRMLGYSVCVPLFATFMFHRYEWVFLLLIEGIFAYVIFHNAWKGWLLMMAHRALLNLSAFVLYGGSFHLGIWFVPCETIPLMYWLFLIVAWGILFFHLKYTLAKQDFIYPIEIAMHQGTIRMNAYLDSGNFAMSEGVPIMILDDTYAEYFTHQRIQWVMADTLEGSVRLPCHSAKVRIKDAPFHNVLICCDKRLSLPLGAKALLNIHMMTQE